MQNLQEQIARRLKALEKISENFLRQLKASSAQQREIDYLEKIQPELFKCSEQISELTGADLDIELQILKILNALHQAEQEFREAHHIGARFSVVSNQITALKTECEHAFSATLTPESTEKQLNTLKADEKLLFVYLFNMHGDKIKNWQKLLTESALHDHGNNRPIYTERSDIEELLRSKQNPPLHGYLEIAIPKSAIQENAAKDNLGHSLARLKNHPLTTKDVRSFVHLNQHYKISNAEGELTANHE